MCNILFKVPALATYFTVVRRGERPITFSSVGLSSVGTHALAGLDELTS